MGQFNVILCDVCMERVAVQKCDLCGKDICESSKCSRIMPIDILNFSLRVPFCKECMKEITKRKYDEDFFPEKLKEEIKEHIISYFKKKIILEKIKDEEDDT